MPNRHRQERDFLLWLTRTAPSRRPGNQSLTIHPSSYAAVYTPPINNSAPIYGPCLIWRHGLNAGGYGVLTHGGRRHLAHRVTYKISRGSIPPNTSILHMCNRRSCVQPSHLYVGTPQDNADDKMAKTESFFLPKLGFEKMNRQVRECAPHVWLEPPQTQASFAPEPEHECNFVIPAGESLLCEVCYQPVRGSSLWWFIRETDGGIDPQERERRARQEILRLNPTWGRL